MVDCWVEPTVGDSSEFLPVRGTTGSDPALARGRARLQSETALFRRREKDVARRCITQLLHGPGFNLSAHSTRHRRECEQHVSHRMSFARALHSAWPACAAARFSFGAGGSAWRYCNAVYSLVHSMFAPAARPAGTSSSPGSISMRFSSSRRASRRPTSV